MRSPRWSRFASCCAPHVGRRCPLGREQLEEAERLRDGVLAPPELQVDAMVRADPVGRARLVDQAHQTARIDPRLIADTQHELTSLRLGAHDPQIAAADLESDHLEQILRFGWKRAEAIGT